MPVHLLLLLENCSRGEIQGHCYIFIERKREREIEREYGKCALHLELGE